MSVFILSACVLFDTFCASVVPKLLKLEDISDKLSLTGTLTPPPVILLEEESSTLELLSV